MNKEIIRMIILMLQCAIGGLLIGFNAGKLSNGLNAALFVIGIVLISMSTTVVGLLHAAWKRRKSVESGDNEHMKKSNSGKTTPFSIAIAIVIVAAVALFLNTGNISVIFEGTSLKMKSTYWVDRDIRYSEIDTAAYREDLDVGVRTFGVGSMRLSVGNFQNEEFGSYTLYAYAKAKAFIVLTSDDGKTFVIGMGSAKDTQTVYDTLLERMGEQQ